MKTRIGYGQVEPNHLSAQRNGQIYGQLAASKTAFPTNIENGRFAKYDYAAKEVNLSGDGEWMLVLNEVKLYDDAWRVSYKDYAMTPDNNGEMYPRLFKTNVGDIFTTNTIGDGTSDVAVAAGNYLVVGADGYLNVASKPETGMAWKVVKVYTMPDGQPGVKIQRIQ